MTKLEVGDLLLYNHESGILCEIIDITNGVIETKILTLGVSANSKWPNYSVGETDRCSIQNFGNWFKLISNLCSEQTHNGASGLIYHSGLSS